MTDPGWLTVALETTGSFESAGDPWAASAGDFDGMGISAGILQWNIGQGTLQPLIRAVGEAAVLAAMPRYGAFLWRAAHLPPAEALPIVRSWQGRRNRLAPLLKAEFGALMGSEAMRAQQMLAAGKIAARAEMFAASWAASLGRVLTLRDFCWFFDLVVQNGGLKGISIGDVQAVIARVEDPTAMICDWLDSLSHPDARRNAALWRQAELSPLFILSCLRAQKARPEYAAAVMNRKGTIALGQGWVNGTLHDLDARFSAAAVAA